MQGQLFITQGDITRLGADAVAVTSGVTFNRQSAGFAALTKHAEGHDFLKEYERARGARPGKNDPFWVPCHDSRPPFGVVFVTVDGRDQHQNSEKLAYQQEPAYQAVREAIETAVTELRASTQRPLLVALVAFRMNMGGDRENRVRSARLQVQGAYDSLEKMSDVDVAFVLDDAIKYDIFLDARRQEREARAMEAPFYDAATLGPLVEAIKNDECVLFVGAGLSLNAQMPSYRQLIETLAEELGIREELASDVDSYLDIAQAYRDQGKSVDAAIGSMFGVGASRVMPSLAHYLLLSLPIRMVVTTNYDHLLEHTLEGLRRYPLRVVDHQAISQTGYKDGCYVVKFHGDAEQGHAILSRDDYDGFFSQRPEMASLLEGLLLNQTFFFLGYSLRDPNFRQIYSKIDLMLRTAKRPAFATTFETMRGYVKDQYARKQLRLVELGGRAAEVAPTGVPEEDWERSQSGRRLLAFLDRLSEQVSERAHLFLAPEAVPVGDKQKQSLTAVAQSLARAGEHLIGAIDGPLSAEQTRLAAHTLGFLCSHGWRPDPNMGFSVTGLWRRLADNLPTGGGTEREKRQYLTTALRYATDNETARRLRHALESVAEKGSK